MYVSTNYVGCVTLAHVYIFVVGVEAFTQWDP
jgi:hypothetical protein